MLRFLLLLAVLLLAACNGDAPKVNVGSVAPGFSTTDMEGRAVRFPEDFRGQPVVLRFWADWCPSCEGEMKTLETVYRGWRARGLQLLAVNTGQNKATVTAYIRRIGVSYPALLDAKSDIARSYNLVGLPTTFYIGGDGIIKAKVVGEADVEVFDKLAAELLKEIR